MEKVELISNGVHYLSGIGTTSYHDDWNDNDVEINLFKIDGVIYGAYVGPSDGYRSYGRISAAPDLAGCKLDAEFPPQKVIVENVHEHIPADFENSLEDIEKDMIVIKDAVLNKNVLVVGTDYTDSYYPYAIFDYQPMNLYANVEMQAKGFVS